MSNGKIIAVLGHTGTGKTTFIKNKFASRCKNKKIICYARIRTDLISDPNIIVYTNFMEFLDKANKEKDILCLIDEAYTCLPKKLNISMSNPKHPHNKLSNFLVDSRKMNRFVCIILHAYAQVPTDWLIPYLDWFVRFKTQDLLQYQIQRFNSFPNIANNLSQVPVVEDFKPVILKMR